MSQKKADGWPQDIEGFLAKAKRPLIVVLGPTASGKTAFSIRTAVALHSAGRSVEIVNADSRQLYRYMDIGTAKITEEEMACVPHHLLDVLDPSEEAAAGWYRERAHGAIEAVHARGSIPMLVGGSMLYLSSVIDGLSMAPVPDPALRERLELAYDVDGGASLYRTLVAIDPEEAERIHPNNKPRLVRAVEIFELCRRPKTAAVPQSELHAGGRATRDDVSSHCPYDLLIAGMRMPRAALYRMIDDRVRAMFNAGWIGEVESLLARGCRPDDPGMKSHGYREIVSYLEGDADDLPALETLIATKTRQYAKRQETWWKRDPRIHWIDVSEEGST